MNEGRILSIHIIPVEGGPPERVDEVEVKANYGLGGDHRSKPDSKRQLTMIDRAMLDEVAIKVESDCPPCNLMETSISKGARTALQTRAGVCCFVIEGGVLRIGDCIKTLSPLPSPLPLLDPRKQS